MSCVTSNACKLWCVSIRMIPKLVRQYRAVRHILRSAHERAPRIVPMKILEDSSRIWQVLLNQKLYTAVAMTVCNSSACSQAIYDTFFAHVFATRLHSIAAIPSIWPAQRQCVCLLWSLAEGAAPAWVLHSA